jgi:hypothetical protein
LDRDFFGNGLACPQGACRAYRSVFHLTKIRVSNGSVGIFESELENIDHKYIQILNSIANHPNNFILNELSKKNYIKP